jgi:hypothetical protein
MGKNYTVDDVTERTMLTKMGAVQKIYRVAATTASGFAFTVEIPEPDFTKEKVDQILTEKAALLEGVKKL